MAGRDDADGDLQGTTPALSGAEASTVARFGLDQL